MWVYEKDFTECDCCTWSVLEYEEGSRDRAFHASGWFHDLHTGWDLCPACRPDSPFTAVKRVRALADLMDKAPDAQTRAWARRVRNAVGGESDG